MTYLKENIMRLRQEGKTYNQIRDELGCSKGTIAYHVGEGQKEKSLGRMEKRRKEIFEFISQYKESIGCIDCGEDYPYFVLQFDHLRDKEFSISRYRQNGYSLEQIKKEIEKCEVVCANCHSMRTHSRSKRRYR
jgi:biotin operon repressor